MTTPSPEVLVVADRTDGGARAATRLASAGVGPGRVAWVATDRLTTARWDHRVTPDGGCRTLVDLPFGTADAPALRLDSDRLRLVWFRARSWRVAVARADADYAWSEFSALLVSWLAGLGDRTVNGPDGTGPTGPSWSPGHWRSAAARAGFTVGARTAATSARLVDGWCGSPWDARRPVDDRAGTVLSRVLLVDGRPVGVPAGPDAELSTAGARLAAASGCRVLGLGLDTAGRVVDVEPCPALTGPVTVRAAAGLLRTGLAGPVRHDRGATRRAA